MKSKLPNTQKLWATSGMLVTATIAVCAKDHASLVVAIVIGVLIFIISHEMKPRAVAEKIAATPSQKNSVNSV